MPGTFNESNRPRRPGAYFNFVSAERETVIPSAAGVVAIPFTHEWGPFKEVVRLNSLSDFTAIFGDDVSKSGYRMVRQAFQGEGLPGRGGAGAVLAYRYGGSAAARAAVVVQNVTPVNAIKVWGRYQGTRGNGLKYVVRASSRVGWSELLILEGTVEVERWTYPTISVLSLAKKVNAGSNWVTISGPVETDPTSETGIITGVGLTTTAAGGVALAGGNDGTAFTGGDVSAALDQVARERFGLFTIEIDPTVTYSGSAGTAIHTTIATWTKELNAAGKRFMTVLGGAKGEDAATANTRSQGFGDPNIVNLGVGLVRDPVLGDLGTYQLAARVAGIIAQRGERRSITFARFSGLEIIESIAEGDIEEAFDAGTLILSRDNHPVAPVRIEKASTTYQEDVADERDPLVFGQPKYVRTMHGLEMEITEYVEMNVIGLLPITDSTKEALVAEITARALTPRIDMGVIQPGARISTRPNTPLDAEYIDLDYEVRLAPSVEQVFNTVRVTRSQV